MNPILKAAMNPCSFGSHSYFFRLETLSPNFQLEMEVALLRGKLGFQWWIESG
jgi:hypothetical protein